MISLFGNETAAAPQWHSESNQRGTFSILLSCLVTLFLCVWTALHINIVPPLDRGKQLTPPSWIFSKRIWIKSGWLLLGIFTPEIVALSAWQQRLQAAAITTAAQKSFSIKRDTKWYRSLRAVSRDEQTETLEEAESRETIPREWTNVHSFYTVMGGFVIDTHGSEKQIFPGGEERLTLTPAGMVFLMQNDPTCIPDMTTAEINDKSKGDGIAKVLVCIQAGWFCAQSIARLSKGYSISLLELNTLGHTLCAFLIYCLWWDKPLDVITPTFIRTHRVHAIAALMAIHSKTSSSQSWRDGYRITLDPEAVSQVFIQGVTELEPGHTLYRFTKTAKSSGETCNKSLPSSIQNAHSSLELASQALLKYDLLPVTMRKAFKLKQLGFARTLGTVLLKQRNRNLFRDKSLQIHKSKLSQRDQSVDVLAGMTFSAMLYGGLHLLAWNAPFRNDTWKLLWRISAVTVTCSGLFVALLILSGALGAILSTKMPSKSFKLPILKKIRSLVIIFGLVSIALLFGIGLLLYVFSRVYLVMECFLSLPYLPQTAFVVPSWSKWFTHIGN